MAELVPTGRELADLRAREVNAHDHAREAEDKLASVIDKVCADVIESKRLRKERDNLLWTVEELCIEHDMVC